jgi:ribosomal protein S18 acetylase RimI-like enzyme
MTENVSIRRGTLDDVEAIAQFNINMALETESLHLKKQVITRGVRAVMENSQRGFYLVVETTNGEIVSCLMVTNEWSDWRNGNFWWIQSVYVIAPWRRKGLYRLMYEEVKKRSLSEPNVCGFRLYVENENHTAQSTYSSLGMQRMHYLMFEELVAGADFVDT